MALMVKTNTAKHSVSASNPAATDAALPAIGNKQQTFVSEYVKDQNGTQAAIRAGYSAKTANVQGSRLLANVNVRSHIDARLKEVREIVTAETGITLASVVSKIHDLAFFDIRSVLAADGTLSPPSEWPDATAAAIAGIEVFEEFSGVGDNRTLIGHTKKVKLIERTKSLDMLMKHLGGYEKDNAQGAEALGRELRTLGDSERAVRLARLLGSNPEALAAVLTQVAAKAEK